MKRLLIIACLVMMTFCVSGTVSAAYFDVTEQYMGEQNVAKDAQYYFVFDFWNLNTTTTNSSLNLSNDAYSPGTKFITRNPDSGVNSVFSFDYSGAATTGEPSKVNITLSIGETFYTLFSNETLDKRNPSGTLRYDFYAQNQQGILDALGQTGWGTIFIGNNTTADKAFSIINEVRMDVVATPIPSAVWLLGSGLIGIVAIRRRFSK